MQIKKLWVNIILGAALMGLGACEARIESRGNFPDPDLVADISGGGISKQEVVEILGSPSSINIFGQHTWYYISERTEKFAFFAPEIKERQVLVIKFDKKNFMESIEHLDLNDGRQLAHVERVTQTFGQELTVIGQILGNFKRFKQKK